METRYAPTRFDQAIVVAALVHLAASLGLSIVGPGPSAEGAVTTTALSAAVTTAPVPNPDSSIAAAGAGTPAATNLADAPGETGIAVTMYGLGTVVFVLIALGILREGGLRSRRGAFRAAALLALFAAAVLSADALGGGDGDHSVGALAPTRTVANGGSPWADHLRLAFSALMATFVVVAHRAPRPLALTGAPLAGLSTRQFHVLLLLGTATLFEGYDRFILSLALPHIARDLGADESDLGWALAAVRLGVLLALLIGRLADRLGRRPLLLVTIVGYTLATAATGFSKGLVGLVAFQIVAMGFLSAELTLAQVVIAEEYPPNARAAGQGHLGAAAALGAGLAALLFPVLTATDLGWRGMYFIGLAPLALVTYLRRALPETGSWQRATGERPPRMPATALLAVPHRRSVLVLVAVTAIATAAVAAAFAFHSYNAITVHGWPPERVSFMVLAGGGIGFWGWPVFGRLADVVGRRIVGVMTVASGAIAIATFYQSDFLLPAFTAMVFFEAGATVAVNSLTTELFPTALRATAKAWITNAAVLGAMCGLAVVGLASDALGGHANVIALLAVGAVAIGPLLFLLPETRGRPLDDDAYEPSCEAQS